MFTASCHPLLQWSTSGRCCRRPQGHRRTFYRPVIHLAILIDLSGFWTWRTLFCSNRLSPHRTQSMFLKLCWQPACLANCLFRSTSTIIQDAVIGYPLCKLTLFRYSRAYPIIHHLRLWSSKIHSVIVRRVSDFLPAIRNMMFYYDLHDFQWGRLKFIWKVSHGR